MRGAHVMQSGCYRAAGPEQRLGFERSRLTGGELHSIDLRRAERDGGVDHDFAGGHVSDGAQRFLVRSVWHCEHHDVYGAGRSRVIAALKIGGSAGAEHVRVTRRLVRVARPDDDGVAGAAPAQGEGATQLARPADNSDSHRSPPTPYLP
jgi:hypothetical protein